MFSIFRSAVRSFLALSLLPICSDLGCAEESDGYLFIPVTPSEFAQGNASSSEKDVFSPIPRGRLRSINEPLTEQEWAKVDQAINQAVEWIVSTQQGNGSFPTLPNGQPGITSLGVLAMLAQGDMPDQGEHGASMMRAIEYVMSCQKQNGLIALVGGPNGPEVPHNVGHITGQTAVYNHAISSLMLSEAYASTTPDRTKEMQQAIEQALKVTLAEQRRPKRLASDKGGWRYLDKFDVSDADLSIIGWQLMFLRSAKNAGFEVPGESIDQAVACVKRHFAANRGRFEYTVGGGSMSRAMTGAGILALAHAGLHETPEASQAGETMLGYSFINYNQSTGDLDRYHYSLFQCSQAPYQLGDDYWQQFSPPVYRTLLTSQRANGSWDAEQRTVHTDWQFGNVYTTSLVVLSLSAPNQLLPIFQR